MKLSELILTLQKIKIKHGDKEVYLSSDPEGNEFHDLADGLKQSIEFKGDSVIIFPNAYKEYDEIK